MDALGDRTDLSMPLFAVGADARWRRSGLEARVFGAMFAMPEAGDLMDVRRADGSPYFPMGAGVVPTRLAGGSTGTTGGCRETRSSFAGCRSTASG